MQLRSWSESLGEALLAFLDDRGVWLIEDFALRLKTMWPTLLLLLQGVAGSWEEWWTYDGISGILYEEKKPCVCFYPCALCFYDLWQTAQQPLGGSIAHLYPLESFSSLDIATSPGHDRIDRESRSV
ncbi:hypothetical protein AVEN_147861-1 [Araneus ventricosus]|uniref:Uncharacterized protein n=1 Tax=Araneus ventricosus TaxID=182803 RepID=A0A4Y2CSM3_ARAVE|nr:hypothetical protein AVEN_147861-1 [Araneus ventricosus]